MKTKIFGLALILSFATLLGACDGGTTTPDATTSPSPAATGEPTDGATTPATTPGTTTPATTPATTPGTTTPATTPAASPTPTTTP